MNGSGTFYHPNGNTFKGNFKLDKKKGKGILAFPDGRKVEGFWSNGKQNGAALVTSRPGK